MLKVSTSYFGDAKGPFGDDVIKNPARYIYIDILKTKKEKNKPIRLSHPFTKILKKSIMKDTIVPSIFAFYLSTFCLHPRGSIARS